MRHSQRACTLLVHRCETCDKRFQTKKELGEHAKSHAAKEFRCEKCKRSFEHKGRLELHTMSCHSDGNKAKKTDLTSDDEDNFKSKSKGRRRCSPSGKVKCTECPKRFHTFAAFREHLRVHTGERPYVCEICDKGFGTSGNLQRHIRSHKGIKPYTCKMCQRSFTQSTTLVRHTQSQSCFTMFDCPVCYKRYRALNAFRSHLAEHENTSNPCAVCKVVFDDIHALVAHNIKCKVASVKMILQKPAAGDGGYINDSDIRKGKQDGNHSNAIADDDDDDDRSKDDDEMKTPDSACPEADVRKENDDIGAAAGTTDVASRNTGRGKKAMSIPVNLLMSLRKLQQQKTRMDIKPSVCANCKDIFLTAKSLALHRMTCRTKKQPYSFYRPNSTYSHTLATNHMRPKRVIKKPQIYGDIADIDTALTGVEVKKEPPLESSMETIVVAIDDHETYDMGIVDTMTVIGETGTLDIAMVPEIADREDNLDYSDDMQHWKIIHSHATPYITAQVCDSITLSK